MTLYDKGSAFPVAEVGLGQVGVLRRARLQYDQHGAALQKAARLLYSHLDQGAARTHRPARKRRPSAPLRPATADGKMDPS